MTLNYRDYDTLIFDLGNVIIDLDEEGVVQKFSQLNGWTSIEILDLVSKMEIFDQFEKGEVDPISFYDAVNESFLLNISYDQFVGIWNSMLLRLPEGKLHLLNKLVSTHRVLILSNNNALHKPACDEMIKEVSGGKYLTEYVTEAHYSHEMGMRKPDAEIYQKIIDTHSLNPQKSMFFDDKPENISAANKIGIKGVHLHHPDHLYDYFK